MDVRPLILHLLISTAFAEVTDYGPHLPLPRFTHVRMDCWYEEGFRCQVDDTEPAWLWRGHGERLSPGYRRLPHDAAKVNPYSFIIHVYDQYNRLCRVMALPRTHLSMRFTFEDPDGYDWMYSTEGMIDRLHTETDDPNVFPDLSLRRHNNMLIRP